MFWANVLLFMALYIISVSVMAYGDRNNESKKRNWLMWMIFGVAFMGVFSAILYFGRPGLNGRLRLVPVEVPFVQKSAIK